MFKIVLENFLFINYLINRTLERERKVIFFFFFDIYYFFQFLIIKD
jgi:hypothetical protein